MWKPWKPAWSQQDRRSFSLHAAAICISPTTSRSTSHSLRNAHRVSIQILPKQRLHRALQTLHIVVRLHHAIHPSLHHFLLRSQLVPQSCHAVSPSISLSNQRRDSAIQFRARLIAPRQFAQQIRGKPRRIRHSTRRSALLQLLLELRDFLLQRRDASEANFVHHRRVFDHLRVRREAQRRERFQRRRICRRHRRDDRGERVSSERILNGEKNEPEQREADK